MKYLGFALLSAMACQPAMASDSEFMSFVLQNAHKKNFTRCDAAIREIFSNVGGRDIRVITFTDLFDDTIKLAAVYGDVGDSVYAEAEIRHAGSKCRYTVTSAVFNNYSCSVDMAKYPAFSRVAETVGVTFAKNNGGVNRISVPVGDSGCTQLYLRDGEA